MFQPYQLLEIIADLEAQAGIAHDPSITDNYAGMYLRIAIAAETLAGTMSEATDVELGYLRRAVLALENLAGTDGLEETDSYEGYTKRLMDALEALSEVSTAGTHEDRAVIAADSAVFPTPMPMLDANFAAGTYTLDGNAVALADIGALSGNSLGLVGGVGLRAEKLVGSGTTNFATTLTFTPAMLARLNVAGGFTAVFDSVVDNIANGTVAHAESTIQITMRAADWMPYLRALVSWSGPVVQQDHGGFEAAADFADYEYDYVYVREWPISGPATGENNQSYHTIGAFGDVMHAYFGDNPDASVTAEAGGLVAPVELPTTVTTAFVGLNANCHEGLDADKNLVGIRRTVSRLRIYTPGRVAGWLVVEPPIEPLVLSDFKNGVYEIDGVASTLTDMWENSDSLHVGNLPTVTGGVGASWTGTQNTKRAGKAKAAVLAAMPLAQGFTVVADFVLSRTGTLRPIFYLTAHDTGIADVVDMRLWGHDGFVQLSTFIEAAATDTLTLIDNGPHRFAATFGPDEIAFSVDGRPVQVDDMDATVMANLTNLSFQLLVHNTAGTGEATITMEKLAFYPVQPTADLPTLSAI
jgi:hypothetical protein